MALFNLAFAPLALVAAVGPAYPAFPPLPATFAQPLECAAPEMASLDRPFALRCAIAPGAQASSVVLLFRQGGAPVFTAAPTLRTDRGWYVAWLCAHDLVAGPLQYYFEARDVAGKVVASSGSEESPSVMVVGAITERAMKASLTSIAHNHSITDDDDPLAAHRSAQAARAAAEVRAQRRGPGLFLGAGVGIGQGYFPERTLEFHRELTSEPDFGASGRPVFLPEVGWQLADGWAVSAQLRYQPIDPGGSGDHKAGSPVKRSWALLARGQRQFGEGRLQSFLSANLGLGDGFRVVVPARPHEELPRDDTVRGGPLVVGPGGGALYHFGPHLAAAGEVRLLVGAPNLAVIGEVTLGVQVGF